MTQDICVKWHSGEMNLMVDYDSNENYSDDGGPFENANYLDINQVMCEGIDCTKKLTLDAYKAVFEHIAENYL